MLRGIAAALLASMVEARPDYARPDYARPDYELKFRGVRYGDQAVQAARSKDTLMKLHMMRDKGLKGMGAVCLDGTDAGFYFAPAASPTDANNWQISFEGGGWCYDEEDCWGHSISDLGSSLNWEGEAAGGGILSDDCTVNPGFCNFNRVTLRYCDGFSFAGERAEPLVVTGQDGKKKSLYFRGKRILDAALQTLLGMGLRRAERVLLSGVSAGGLATFFHTDYVHAFLKAAGAPLKAFKAAPTSGFFLPHASVEGVPVYAEEIAQAFALSNATGGMNAGCIAAYPAAERWKCSFAASAYAHIEAPIFPLNSALDWWQTGCIYTARLPPGFPEQNGTIRAHWCASVPGWGKCAGDTEQCTELQMVAMNGYMDDFKWTMQNAGEAWQRNGNGAFIHSCHMHTEAMFNEPWTNIAIGGVTMQQAFWRWWKSDSAPASQHTHTDCSYHTDLAPHACNPTCDILSWFSAPASQAAAPRRSSQPRLRRAALLMA